MEKADRVAVVAGDFGWSDIGTWKAMADLYESDEAGNHALGKAVLVESRNCFVQGENRLVAAVGAFVSPMMKRTFPSWRHRPLQRRRLHLVMADYIWKK